MRDNSPRSQRKNKRSRSGDATKLSGKDLLVKTGHMTLFFFTTMGTTVLFPIRGSLPSGGMQTAAFIRGYC